MEFWCMVICVILIIGVLILIGYLVSIQNSIREIANELDEKLETDTNTLISISSGNRKIRSLAEQMNRQLMELRTERLKLKQGDTELKTAITNVSHDLRTPLTAICGYLDLLEQEKPLEQSLGQKRMELTSSVNTLLLWMTSMLVEQ